MIDDGFKLSPFIFYSWRWHYDFRIVEWWLLTYSYGFPKCFKRCSKEVNYVLLHVDQDVGKEP